MRVWVATAGCLLPILATFVFVYLYVGCVMYITTNGYGVEVGRSIVCWPSLP